MSPLRLALLVVVLLTVADVTTPPVIEDHSEVGFCSADCPVQLPGHGAGIAVAPPPSSAACTTAEAVVLAQVPEGALMQRAAAGLAVAIADLLGGVYGRRVLLLVGSGDNGGDALYAGAMLARRGAVVEAILLAEQVHAAGLGALQAQYGRVVTPGQATRPDVVVDGIVGFAASAPERHHRQADLARGDGGDVTVLPGADGELDLRLRQETPAVLHQVGRAAERPHHAAEGVRGPAAGKRLAGEPQRFGVGGGEAGGVQHVGRQRQRHLLQPPVAPAPVCWT